mmetsp:Transcript_56026/g.131112  ORF Transcript_56026/g.131112 Transcript_56026/m.131112 type:complete len:225 (+) Transcript_56026:1220-1894(+)
MQTKDWTFHVLSQFSDSDKLKDARLDVLKTIVIFLKDLPGGSQVKHVFSRLRPGQSCQCLQVGSAHCVLRVMRLYVLQSLELLLRQLERLRRHLRFLQHSAKIRDLLLIAGIWVAAIPSCFFGAIWKRLLAALDSSAATRLVPPLLRVDRELVTQLCASSLYQLQSHLCSSSYVKGFQHLLSLLQAQLPWQRCCYLVCQHATSRRPAKLASDPTEEVLQVRQGT